MHFTRKSACHIILAFFSLCSMAGSVNMLFAADSAQLLKAVNSVTNEELKHHATVLADDTLEGREAGSRGSYAAANYIIAALSKQGLLPAGDSKSYFQSFRGTSRNILAYLPGSDPKLKDEFVVIGAHYDHVGYGRSNNSYGPIGYIHNGADDNASGTSGLMEIIDGVKQMDTLPKRSILFCFWDAEESGLHGSKHWLAAPTLPLDKVKFYINMDMIGRLRKSRVEVYGTRTASGLRTLVSQQNNLAGLDIDFTWKLKEDSDHYPFFARSIPILMFHTGLHEDYHRPSDDIEKLDVDGMKRVAQVTLLTLLELADRETLPTFRPESRQENPQTRQVFEQPTIPFAPRFGMPWVAEPAAEGSAPGAPLTLKLLRPSPGSACEAAGLQANDLLVSFEGKPIESEDKLRLQMLAADGARKFGIIRQGKGEPAEISITPLGNPIRLGLSFRRDTADPSSMLVTQVATFSPAALAGIKIGDRVVAINQKPFATEQEFSSLLAPNSSPLELQIERQGSLKQVTLQLAETP